MDEINVIGSFESVKDSSPSQTPRLTFFNMLVSRWIRELNPEDFRKCSICHARSVWERNEERLLKLRGFLSAQKVKLTLEIHLERQ